MHSFHIRCLVIFFSCNIMYHVEANDFKNRIRCNTTTNKIRNGVVRFHRCPSFAHHVFSFMRILCTCIDSFFSYGSRHQTALGAESSVPISFVNGALKQ